MPIELNALHCEVGGVPLFRNFLFSWEYENRHYLMPRSFNALLYFAAFCKCS